MNIPKWDLYTSLLTWPKQNQHEVTWDMLEIIEELEVFKQELLVKLRSQHCLIADAECFDEDIIMGLLHQERRTIKTLERIITKIESIMNTEGENASCSKPTN